MSTRPPVPVRPLGAAQPIMDSLQDAGHTIMHPIDTLGSMLGMAQPGHQPPPPDPNYLDQRMREAAASFQHPPATTGAPVIRRKMSR